MSSGEPFNQLVKISGRELLEASGKGLGGASYQEMDRFFLRMAGTMIGAGRDWRQEGESGGTEKRPRSNKGIVFISFKRWCCRGKSMRMALWQISTRLSLPRGIG